jgi:hypothetical protein
MNKKKSQQTIGKIESHHPFSQEIRNPLELSLRMITIFKILDLNCLKAIGNSLASHHQTLSMMISLSETWSVSYQYIPDLTAKFHYWTSYMSQPIKN